MPDGKTADVYQSRDGYVHINAESLVSAKSRGSLLYNLGANFAYNNRNVALDGDSRDSRGCLVPKGYPSTPWATHLKCLVFRNGWLQT